LCSKDIEQQRLNGKDKKSNHMCDDNDKKERHTQIEKRDR